jgi:ribose transport system substrate-binding protein
VAEAVLGRWEVGVRPFGRGQLRRLGDGEHRVEGGIEIHGLQRYDTLFIVANRPLSIASRFRRYEVTRQKAALALLVVAAAVLAGRAGAGGNGSINGLVYGIPSPLATEPGENNINNGVKCWAKAHGGKVTILDANLDVNKQVTDFDTLLTQGANVLPFVALDPKAFRGPFARAKAKGATVAELYNPGTTAPVGVYESSRQAGMDAAKLVAKKYPGGSKALVIGGPPIPAVLERIKGFTTQAKKYKIQILQQQDNLKDNVNDARTLADDLLTKHPDAQVVFGFNDNSAIGAGLAAKSRGLHLLIFGINGTEQGISAVKQGLITATYEADQFKIGYLGAKVGAQVHAGMKVKSKVPVSMVRWDKASVAHWIPFSKRCAAMK